MAGIAFKIRELLKQETYLSDLKAHSYSIILSSGTWILAVACLALLNVFSIPMLSLDEQNLFRVTVIYTFAFSLILSGSVQLVVTRFVSDKLYNKEPSSIMPALVITTIIVALSAWLVATLFYGWFVGVSLSYKIIGTMLFVIISCIWITTVFFGALEDYGGIALSFFIGNAISFSCATILGAHLRTEGYLAGFTIGQACILYILMFKLFKEFPFPEIVTREMLGYFRKFTKLAVIGFLYNLGIWADKFVFWFSPTGTQAWSFFRTHYPYDSSMFLAYLTIVPALGIFLLRVETDFYEKYGEYYNAILSKVNFEEIERRRQDMRTSLLSGIFYLIKVQGMITAVALIMAEHVLRSLGLAVFQLDLLRFGLIGAFFHSIFLVMTILLCYFEFWNSVLVLTVVMLCLNTGLAAVTVKMGFPYFGSGYAVTTLIVSVTAFFTFLWKINRLNSLTFIKSSVPPARLSMPALKD